MSKGCEFERMEFLVQSPSTLGRALRDVRKAKRWSQHRLAELAGTTQGTVSNVERGAAGVSFDTLLRLLAALKLEIVLRARPTSDLASVWSEQEQK